MAKPPATAVSRYGNRASVPSLGRRLFFAFEHPAYWKKVGEETEGSGDFLHSTCLFIDSEKREHTEDEMIKIENIKGKLILLGANDDSFWEAGKYVRRMDQRLKERPHECEYEAVAYRYGTHFVLPESMLRMHCRRA